MKNIILGIFLGLILLMVFLFNDGLNITGYGSINGEGDIECYDDSDCFSSEIIDPCLVPTCVYSPSGLSSVCVDIPITSCTNGDSCCPDGCNYGNDNNCDSLCGNGVINDWEFCDGSNIPLDSSCGDFSYDGGTLGCNSDCTGYVFDECFYFENGGNGNGNDGNGDYFVGESEFGEQIIITQQICNDGTSYGSCSSTKPYYCSEGILIRNCNVCGCGSGELCITDQCLTQNEIDDINNMCGLLSEQDCKEDKDCFPVYSELFVKVYRVYSDCLMKECKHFSKKECKERAGCKPVYKEFCIGKYWCFFKYYNECKQGN